jgi:exonuclease III
VAITEPDSVQSRTDEHEPRQALSAPVEELEGGGESIPDGSESWHGPGDDIGVEDCDGNSWEEPESPESNDNDGEAKVPEPESSVRVASWNIHGLASYKQKSLLHFAADRYLDVLAVCETHLLNSEQQVQWEQTVGLPDSGYCWFGRPAVKERPSDRGRGSGGVGILIRREWRDFCSELPVCEHPCLHFVRLELPNAPQPFYLGVAYAVPVGSSREQSNAELLEELTELAGQYQQLGVVLVCGDFNTHIACIPSALLSDGARQPARPDDGEAEPDAQVTLLERTSVDVAEGALVDEHPATGVALMELLDGAGLVALNGLCAVGDGSIAEATFGSRSVIDLILVSADHWQLMDSVRVVPDACGAVASDHQLVCTHLRYQPVAGRAARSVVDPAADANKSVLINSTRYRTATRGLPDHFAQYEARCREVLPALVQSWTERAGGAEGLQVEEAWAEFTAELGAVGATTLGVRRKRPAQGDSIRRAHGVVRAWCRQRKAI